MGDDKTETILIIDRVMEPAAVAGRPLQARGFSEAVLSVTERGVEEVRENMTRFIRGVQKILAEGAAIGGEFRIEEVEVSAQLTAEGKIGFAGTGVNLQGETGLKLIFKRPPAKDAAAARP